MRGSSALGLAVMLMLAACSTANSPTRPTVDVEDSTSAASNETSTEPASPVSLDMSKRPFLVFSPIPPLPEGSELPLPHGSDDWDELFVADAPWEQAAAHIDVLQLPSWYVRFYATDDDLVRLIENLNDRGIALGISMEPLEVPDPSECDPWESFEGSYDLVHAQRIADLGGFIQFMVIDEPYAFAHKLDVPGACQRPVDQVAAETADFVRRFREIFPGAIVGSIEPLWANPRIDADDMRIWLDSYRAAAGEPFDFLYLDVAWPLWQNDDLGQVISEIEVIADERDVPLGVIYIGDADSPTDTDWLQAAASRFTLVEETWGVTPDHVPIMSWTDRPYRLLPETDSSTFTSLVNQYFGERTSLTVATPADDGSDPSALGGLLTTTDGMPVSGAAVVAEATPLSATPQVLSVVGVVPDTTTRALIQIRSNADELTPGSADVAVDDVAYLEEGGFDRVSNGDFNAGMADWGAYGEGSGAVTSGDRGDGNFLLLTATPDQPLFVDSVEFDVTPGAEFELSVLTAVPAASIGTSAVSVVFLEELEVLRETIYLEPAAITLDAAVTIASGAFVVDTSLLAPGPYDVVLRFLGDLDHWPSETMTSIEIE